MTAPVPAGDRVGAPSSAVPGSPVPPGQPATGGLPSTGGAPDSAVPEIAVPAPGFAPAEGGSRSPRGPRTAWVAGGLFALAVVTGLVWVPLAPTMSVTVVSDDQIQVSEAAISSLFGGVGVFALLMFAYGIVCALVSWWGLKAVRGPAGLGYALVSALGGGVVAMGVADWFGARIHPGLTSAPGDYEVLTGLWLDDAHLGALPAPWVLLICAPLTAALAYLVAVLAARRPDLGRGA